MILIKLASRGRPKRLLETIKNIRATCEVDYHILLSLDLDDVPCPIITGRDITVVHAHSFSKIHAMNRDLNYANHLPWKYAFMGADDVEFICRWGAEVLRNNMGILHFPDGNHNELMNTHPFIHRRVFEERGYLYNDKFIATHCDLDVQEWGERNNENCFINKQIYQHNHWVFNKGAKDEVNVRWDTDDNFRKDQALFIELWGVDALKKYVPNAIIQ